MLNLLLLLACLHVLLAGSECKSILMGEGGVPWEGRRSFVHLSFHNGVWPAVRCPECQSHNSLQAAKCMDGFRSANWKGRGCLWANDGPCMRVGNKPLNVLASNKARQERPPHDRAIPRSGCLLSAFLLAEGCPKRQGLIRVRLLEMGDAWVHQKAHSKPHCLHYPLRSCQTRSSY